MSGSVKSDRIDGIDVLRAFALLGILLVHAVEGFGFMDSSLFECPADDVIVKIVNNLFHNRSNSIFSLLFGCSFWFLLRNPGYSSVKFVWRCFLLAVIGLVAKLFFTFDILLWYGMWGAVLALFRRFPANWLFVISMILILSSAYVETLHIGDIFHADRCPDRYVDGYTAAQIIDYPLSWSVRVCLESEFRVFSLRTLSLMMFGYWLGCKGYLMRWREIVDLKLVLIFGVAALLIPVGVYAVRGDGSSMLFRVGSDVQFMVQALFLSIAVMYVCRNAGSWIRPFACYGRLGLTNYFFQGVVGVILFSEWFVPYNVNLTLNVAVLLVFYALQVAFSVIWCRSHRYGPLEYLWRRATNIIPTKAYRKA